MRIGDGDAKAHFGHHLPVNKIVADVGDFFRGG